MIFGGNGNLIGTLRYSGEELKPNHIDITADYRGVSECSPRFHHVTDLYHVTK